MHRTDGVKPLEHAVQRGPHGRVLGPARLHLQKAGDELQIVLHPVVQLVDQGHALLGRGLEFAGAHLQRRLKGGGPALRGDALHGVHAPRSSLK